MDKKKIEIDPLSWIKDTSKNESLEVGKEEISKNKEIENLFQEVLYIKERQDKIIEEIKKQNEYLQEYKEVLEVFKEVILWLKKISQRISFPMGKKLSSRLKSPKFWTSIFIIHY